MNIVYEVVGRFVDWYFGLPDLLLIIVCAISIIVIAVAVFVDFSNTEY